LNGYEATPSEGKIRRAASSATLDFAVLLNMKSRVSQKTAILGILKFVAAGVELECVAARNDV
jgi:hypothetical protein